MESIWGSSPTDVWVVGPGGDKDKTIYHYNGQKWVNDGISRPLAPAAVFGLSQSDVWFGSYGNTIWNYDGNTLSKFQDYTIPNYPYAGIQNFWGDNPNNVYAVGFADSNNINRGVIQRFYNSQWNIVYISPLISVYEVFIFIYKGNSTDNNYYLLSYYGVDADTAKIYEYDGNNKLKGIYSSPASQAGLALINNEVFFILGNQICSRQNNAFNTLFTVPGNNFLHGIGGRNKDDIILEMTDGIVNYNGSDVEYLYYFNHPNISIFGTPVIFEKEVFILAYDFQNNLNLIFRGKLN